MTSHSKWNQRTNFYLIDLIFNKRKAKGHDQLVDLAIVSLLRMYFNIHDNEGSKNISDFYMPFSLGIFLNGNNIAKLIMPGLRKLLKLLQETVNYYPI